MQPPTKDKEIGIGGHIPLPLPELKATHSLVEKSPQEPAPKEEEKDPSPPGIELDPQAKSDFPQIIEHPPDTPTPVDEGASSAEINSPPKPTLPKRPDNYKYVIEDFRLIKTLGDGSYGEVLLAVDTLTLEPFAIKRLYKKNLFNARKHFESLIEKMFLQYFEFPFMPRFVASFQDPENLYMVQEYIENGDLAKLVSGGKVLNKTELRFVAAEMVSILETFQSNGIIHRDIKPENIALDSRFHLRLIDYGCAGLIPMKGVNENIYEVYLNLKERHHPKYDAKKSADKKLANHRHQIAYDEDHRNSVDPVGTERERLERTHTFVGTASYIPPEFLSDSANKDFGCDLWSLGISLYRLATGTFPYPIEIEYETIQAIKGGKLVIKEDLDPKFLHLLWSLLKRNSKDRLGAGGPGTANSIDRLKAHEYFEGIDWANIWTENSPLEKSVLTARRGSWGRSDSIFDNFKSLKRTTIIKSEGKLVKQDSTELPVTLELFSDGVIKVSSFTDDAKDAEWRLTNQSTANSPYPDLVNFNWAGGRSNIKVNSEETGQWVTAIKTIAGTLPSGDDKNDNSSNSGSGSEDEAKDKPKDK